MSRVYLSCKFPKTRFAKMCISYAKQIGMELIHCDYHAPGDIHDKIKEEIYKCQAILFLLEDNHSEDGQRTNYSPWIAEERCIASGRNLNMGIINKSSYDNIPSIFNSNIEVLKRKDVKTINTHAYLANFSHTLEKIFVPRSTFSRNYLKHKVEINKDGSVKYYTTAEIVCLAEALNDFSHSIYTQYSPCWNATGEVARPEINAKCENGRSISISNFVQNEQKFNWTFVLENPLKRNDVLRYGFVVEFPEYFPASKEKLRETVRCRGYPFLDDRIEHHYFVNTQTDKLVIELKFEDSTVATDFKTIAYSSRQYCEDCVDHAEVMRIANFLKELDEYVGEEFIRLTIPDPKTGYTYSISWELEE